MTIYPRKSEQNKIEKIRSSPGRLRTETIFGEILKKMAKGEISPQSIEKSEKALLRLTEKTGDPSFKNQRQTAFNKKTNDPHRQLLIAIVTELLRQNRMYQDQLNDITETYEDVIGLITHEFKNILTSVHGYNMILERQIGVQQDPAVLKNLQSSDRLTQQLFNMADSLLKMSLSEKGLLKPEYKLIHFIEDIIIPIQADLTAEQADRNISIVLNKPLGDLIIEADDGLLDIVMRNLLINALKYGKNGTAIEITVTRKNKDLLVVVKNECASLPDDFCAGIFKKFKTKKIGSVKGGSGIGLYNAKKIIDLHQGEITCRAEKNNRVVFEFTLPQNIL